MAEQIRWQEVLGESDLEAAIGADRQRIVEWYTRNNMEPPEEPDQIEVEEGEL